MLEQLMNHFDGIMPSHCFFGVVEDVNDPLMIGRVRVRCFGYHAENRVLVPTSHLPWALVLMPATSASSGGVGQTMGLQPGSWVFGFFLDGKKAQMPFVLGSIHHQHKPNPPGYGSSPSPTTGFNTMPNPPQFRASLQARMMFRSHHVRRRPCRVHLDRSHNRSRPMPTTSPMRLYAIRRPFRKTRAGFRRKMRPTGHRSTTRRKSWPRKVTVS